jgi:CelD/BcsL family acetyltransferase involved in cellulose biosynthesis
MTSTAEAATSRRQLATRAVEAIAANSEHGTHNVSLGALRESLIHDRKSWVDVAYAAGIRFPSLLYDWHSAWAKVTDSTSLETARVIRVDEASGLLGIVPFSISKRASGPLAVRQLEWPLEDLACPDHLDVPVVSATAARVIVRTLLGLPWDALRLEALAHHSPGAQRLASALSEQGCRVEWLPGEVCPYVDLPETWDSYLASLSPTRRQTVRRKERALFREHAVTVVDYATDRLEEGWSHLLRLHHLYRPHDSAFGPNEARLQKVFASALASQNRVWLTTLDVDGVPVAAWYGFATGDTMCFYQSGRDPAWEHASVGQVLMGIMIRRAIEHGFKAFDFLRGDEPYKMTWTSTKRDDRILVAYRATLRGVIASWSDGTMRAARRATRRMRPGSARQSGKSS